MMYRLRGCLKHHKVDTGLAVRNPKGDGGQVTTDDFELSLGDPEGTYISVSLAG